MPVLSALYSKNGGREIGRQELEEGQLFSGAATWLRSLQLTTAYCRAQSDELEAPRTAPISRIMGPWSSPLHSTPP
jgi:hypothetical protein